MKTLTALAAALLAALLGLGGCAADTTAPGAPRAEPVQREYRTGSRFPVKDNVALTPEERQQQLDDARAAAQRAPAGPGVPMPR